MTSATRSDRRPLRFAGVLIVAGGIVFILGVISAQAYYPGYSITQNALSDLGATCQTRNST